MLTASRTITRRKNNMMRLLGNGKTFLQVFREDRDLTRKMLAEQTGISVRTIESWEQHRTDLGSAAYDTVMKICKVLDVKPDDLIEEPDE